MNVHDRLISLLARFFRQEPMSMDLLRLSLAKDPPPAELTDWFGTYNFENLNHYAAYLLADVSRKIGFAGVPERYLPRVRGILRNLTAENGLLLSDTVMWLRACRDAGITPLLLGSGVMRIACTNDEPIPLWYIDACAFERNGDALALFPGLGWQTRQNAFFFSAKKQCFSVRLYRPGADHPVSRILDGIRSAAHSVSYQGTDVQVTSPEGTLLFLLFLVLIQRKNERMTTIKNAVTILRLTDRDAFVSLAEKTGTQTEAFAVLEALDRLFPEAGIGTWIPKNRDLKAERRFLSTIQNANPSRFHRLTHRLFTLWKRITKKNNDHRPQGGT